MILNVHLTLEGMDEVVHLLRTLNRKADFALNRLEIIMAKIDDLKAAVQRNSDAEDSVIVLLQGISQQLKDAVAANDPAQIDAVISSLDANTARLAAAVVENTPSTPPVAPAG
jgi:hypothetical protein